ncbi:MAG: RNA polymerase sigma factor [Verrucomicrobiae bacterium]|nr:RNA polymerase sigma factor [Verrucomicrobiae bacterium]MDW7980558.1 RNA polymerase sigma factor [Verrucomicrobiales bacterium]
MDAEAEAELLARCRRGEQAAWDQLLDVHYPAVWRFVYQLGHEFTPEDAEEICQETFLAAVRHMARFRGHCRVQTWLFQIAINKARDYRARRLAAKRGGSAKPVSLQARDPETGLGPDPASTAPGPDEVLVSAEQAALISRALDELGAPCRELVQLRYFADLSYGEIARALNLNVKTVSSRLSRCLDALEQIMRRLSADGQTAAVPVQH